MTLLPRALAVAAAATVLCAPSGALAKGPTWSFAQADVPAAQAAGAYGQGITVAVIDSGVDASTPDFGGRVASSYDCTEQSCRPGGQPDKSSCDQFWHGTHVAGTLASSTSGVAPLAQLMSLRVLRGSGPSTGCGSSSLTVATAIIFATDNGAKVINISLGDVAGAQPPPAGKTTDIQSAATYAAQHGVLVITSAGNQSATAGSDYGSDVLVVAATAPSGALASYTDSGGPTALAAPGGDCGSGALAPGCAIESTVPSTFYPAGYAYSVGTSSAAPLVSGIAALLFAQNPGISRAAVIQALESTAHPLAGTAFGLVDAGAALGVHPNPSLVVPPKPGLVVQLAGCPTKVSATKGHSATISCRRFPAGGATVRLQQRTSKGWVTVRTVKTKANGLFSVHTPSVQRTVTLRLVTGAATSTLHATVRKH